MAKTEIRDRIEEGHKTRCSTLSSSKVWGLKEKQKVAKTATYIKDVAWMGDARLFKLSEPVSYESRDYIDDKLTITYGQTNYVVVSAVKLVWNVGNWVYDDGVETYIFPTDENGFVLSWGDLDGSYKGGLSHIVALEDVGYEVVYPPIFPPLFPVYMGRLEIDIKSKIDSLVLSIEAGLKTLLSKIDI